jgi:pilus assembly protein CpaF
LVGSDRFVPILDGAARPASRAPIAVLSAFGALAGDDSVTDVFLNGDGSVWCDRGDGNRPVDGLHFEAAAARDLAVRLIAAGGRHLDDASPCVDVRLGRGVRVHAVLPPLSAGGALLSIRIPRSRPLSLDELERQGFFERIGLDRVADLVRDRTNLLITGAGGSGKTTLLGALLAAASETDRIVVVEDVAELSPPHPHLVSLEARQPNLEGAGGVALDRLLREALRMRPDRLVVGECRGAELRELMAALNTGHDGGAGTLHANSLSDVPARLEALGALAGLSAEAVARQAVSAFGAVLHVARSGGRRRLESLGRLTAGRRGRLAIGELP